MTRTTAPRAVWRTQIAAIARAEVVRSVFSRRALPSYLLVGLPLLLMVMRALFMPDSLRVNATDATNQFAEVFHIFFLRFVVFFTNAMIFVRLFRGEILDKSLHYTLLAPVRREVLVVGKYLGGLVASLLILLPTTILTYVLVFLPHGGAGWSRLGTATSLGDLAAYLWIVVLACVAYGALFLLAGLFFKNPMVPAVLFLGWEVLTPFLPTLLKYLSFTHYLASFAPVPVRLAAFAVFAQPVAWWAALLALLGAAALLLTLATLAARRLEVTYSAD
ncbi:MAG: ABC-2 transporter permease [Holophagae bacterium]|jgi:ABC-type transport system involved in multi-copper enzyme maturation permease subunit